MDKFVAIIRRTMGRCDSSICLAERRLLTGALCALFSIVFGQSALGQVAELAAKPVPTGIIPVVSSPYADPRVGTWTKLVLSGQRELVLAAVERDLRSGSPSALAPEFWTALSLGMGRLNPDGTNLPPDLAGRLGVEPALAARYAHRDFEGMFALCPASGAAAIEDPFSLALLQSAAIEAKRSDDALAYALAEARRAPEAFLSMWDLIDSCDSNDRARSAVLAAAASRGSLSGSVLARSLTAFLAIRPATAAQRLTLVNDFLAAHPSDPFALRYKGEILKDQGFYDGAAAARVQAQTIYPLSSDCRFTAPSLAEALLRGAHFAEARRSITQTAALDMPDAARAEPFAALNYAKACGDAGEQGERRRALEAAEKKFPGSTQIQAEYARLEIASRQFDSAVQRARAAAAGAPDDPQNRDLLIETLLDDKKNDEAYRLFLKEKDLPEPASTDAFWLGANALIELGRPDDRVSLCREFAARFPQFHNPVRILGAALEQAGKHADAAEAMRAYLDIDSTDTWVLYWLQQALQHQDAASAAAKLDVLRNQKPWVQWHWDEAAKRLGADSEDRKDEPALLALWHDAADKNPGAYWPWGQAANVCFHRDDIDGAEQVVAEAVQRLADSPNRFEPASDTAWAVRRRVQLSRGGDSAAIGRGLAALDAYEPYGYIGWAENRRSWLLSAAGRYNEAWEADLKAIRADPDSSEYLWDLQHGDFGKTDHKGFWQLTARYVDRDPYSGERLNNLVEWHVEWNGSPIVAYKYARLCQTRDPSFDQTSKIAKALGQLGDTAADFTQSYYKSNSGISASDRYVLWFNASRAAAEKRGTSSSVVIDPDKLEAAITRPDGIIVKRRAHLVSGKPTLLQIGQAKIELSYDDSGEDLTRIQASSGASMRLDYDDHHHIIRIRMDKKTDVRFRYNAADKPTEISLSGVGTIRVTYDASGEIKKVESVTPDGRPAANGRSLSLTVTNTFQSLLDMIRPFGSQNVSDELPELPWHDSQEERLNAAASEASVRYDAQPTRDHLHASLHARMELAAYLTEHMADAPRYMNDARSDMEEVFETVTKRTGDNIVALEGGNAVSIWHRLMTLTHRNGLDAEDWAYWIRMRDWLDRQGNVPGCEALLRVARDLDAGQSNADTKLQLLKTAQWEQDSYLENDAYWRRVEIADLLPRDLRSDGHSSAVLIRRSGREVVGTNHGFAWKDGYWRWRAWDEDVLRLSSDLAPGKVKASSDVLALTEDGAGNLWVGTADGLLRISGESDDSDVRRLGAADGLGSPRVEHLVSDGPHVFAATPQGIRCADTSNATATFRPVPGLPEEAPVFLSGPNPGDAGPDAKNDGPVLVGLVSGVWAVRADAAGNLHAARLGESARDSLYQPQTHELIFLRGGGASADLTQAAWDGDPAHAPERERPLRDRVNATQAVYGLARLPIGKDVDAVAVCTDRGLSLFYNDHIEEKNKFPQASGPESIEEMSGVGGVTLLRTSLAVYALERGQTMGDSRGCVYDLLSDPKLGLTYVARGEEGLEVVRGDAPKQGALPMAQISCRCLARDSSGRLIADDGTDIVAFEVGEAASHILFHAASTPSATMTSETADHIGSLVAASDGTIWATCGASVWRFKDGKSEEFSIFVNPDRFPAASEMISRVVETVDHNILVVASNEGHLAYRGQALFGGLLQFDPVGDRFRQVPIGSDHNANFWFFSGYTAIDEHTAIAGTGGSFAQDKDGTLAAYSALQDATYARLQARMPMLYLGTRGAKLGNDTWLFGCAGGVVGWQAGHWFCPDRLNGLLPDQDLREYGGRTVHAVAADSRGRVYIGTDIGQLIYDTGGDGTALRIANDDVDAAFADAEAAKLRRERDILLSSLPPSSPLLAKVKEVQRGEKEIAALHESIANAVSGRLTGMQSGQETKTDAAAPSAEDTQKKRDLLDAKLREQNARLIALEKLCPSAWQMLKLDPMDARSEPFRHQLRTDEAIIQYIPTPQTLFIQVITRDTATLHEVPVTADELTRRIRQTVLMLSHSGALRGGHLADGEDIIAKTAALLGPNRNEELAWLYDRLLRPAEGDIRGARVVYIVPSGPLTYLPFGALRRTPDLRQGVSTPGVAEYALQRYVFACLPSLYIFDLARQAHTHTHGSDMLALGDPDGSLVNAREEASDVRALIGGHAPALLGNDATFSSMMQYGASAGVLHLATHGFLDPEKPQLSYLLLAGNYKLSVLDLSLQTFPETTLAVLSACQSGIGSDGMEYATLARAFAQAGVPSVVATLWCIADKTTPELMHRFYTHLKAGDDRAVALTEAQREMAAGADGPDAADPSAWAGFVLFGDPWGSLAASGVSASTAVMQ